MKIVNLVLASMGALLCLVIGAMLQSWLLLGLSLLIALGAFVLDQKLERHHLWRAYGIKRQRKPASQSSAQYEEIHAPDFFS